ncbi:MAG: NYN domain-containing protein [Bacteroidetes bacterium]|nr:NYN domain-containing protein [Bacteroidota bacterium]
MNHYIIDGNNLIGKINFLHKIQQKDKQHSREKLAFMIDNYFHEKKAKVTIHFDGFKNLPIKLNQAKIIYSDSKSADDMIKNQIELANNRKNLVVITSDNNIQEFARVCSCLIIKSEEFARTILSKKQDDEKDIIEKMKNDVEEWRELFNRDEEQQL